jgi:hypothetical protein
MPSKHRTHGNFGDNTTFKRISNDYYNCAVDSSNNMLTPITSAKLEPTWINYKIALLYDKHNMDALQATKDMCDSYYTIMSGSLCGWDCIAKTRFLYKNGAIKTINPAWAG